MLLTPRHDEPHHILPTVDNTLGSREWLCATCIHLLIIMNDHNSPVPRLDFCLLQKEPLRAVNTTNSLSGLAQHKKLSPSSLKCFSPLISDGFAFRFKRCHEHLRDGDRGWRFVRSHSTGSSLRHQHNQHQAETSKRPRERAKRASNIYGFICV